MFERIFQLSRYRLLDSPGLKHNLRAHILDGSVFGFALSFVSVQTVLPVFIQQVGGGTTAIGSVTVLWTLGICFPQMFLLRFTHTTEKIQPLVLRYGLFLRLCFFVLGVFSLLVVGKIPSAYAVPGSLVLIGLTALTGSLGMPPWFQLFTKTVPVLVRGRLLAMRQMLSSMLGMIAGVIVSFILKEVSFPANFALLFFIAFSLSMVSFYFLKMLREPESVEAQDQVSNGIAEGMDGRRILREHRNFRNFLVSDALMLVAMTAAAFYAVYGIEKFRMPLSYAGVVTVVTMGSMVVANLIFGYVADVFGHKINLIALAASAAMASLLAVLAPNIVIYTFVFFFMGCTITLQGISRMTFVAELCSDEERPLYVALTNTLTAPTVFIGVLAGAMIPSVGYDVVLMVYSLIGLAAAVWLKWKVIEPRVSDTK